MIVLSYDAILQVNKAEETAHGSLAEAQAKAREVVAAAQNTAGERLAQMRKQLAAETAEVLRIEREKNEADLARWSALAGKDCDLLREKSLPHLDAAVSRVMERVMGQWHS